jgi:hypothetical protein
MDWIAFLEAHDVEYVSSGPNTKRGNISIQCPWCGSDDPSEHLSISLTKDAYGCWRNTQHAGRKPFPLVAALLNCSFSQAKLVVQQFSAADPESLEEAVMALGGATVPVQQPKLPQELPKAFKPIKPTGLTRRFWRYLEGRGFDDVGALIDRYGLLCCQIDRWKDRVIIPIYSGGKLAGWTARAIQATVNAPRYLTSSPEVKNTIFNEDELTGGKTLFITEGPFDALKVDFYGYPKIRATCLYGVNPTLAQISILRQVIKRYDHVGILFDSAAQEQAMQLRDYLPSKIAIASLPKGVDDPGNLSQGQILNLG